ncbi:uridine diphosphate-N-acetylglucosamine-binding protein YvcK [Aliivibrio fischeri]|uniref:uridine diphosphate-N-acetylglucosamine-binding protein YvcK n=1 Tax=Aliivibrio fischeri TaxID=668 RepID=UPI001F1D8ABF|nr:uridine diphosphate-N-acetylglucosamine-binding protein YvcK [Aliivibrio fischeri]MCE7576049.1 uridine diphosphate-N-acetylglucosamine-binding protein YvcK [Aliivibrio fischeri]MCE7588339.1 uridine diphosphate-N-acetylglucosamine-binding protein YvcK [Aliivibrio fischeri]
MIEHKIVAIGGGHGLGRVLAALSDFGGNATGIVATTDNGGSTGRIRECQGGIAWGDTRNCINQLIMDPSISSMMFEYRFKGQGELHGHNLGNLMLTALDNLSVRPLDAINLIRDMLKVETHIIPMSEHPSDLGALTSDLRKISGETNVDEMDELPLRLFLDPEVPATLEAIDAVKQADLILLGPGSFLTSIMPPLLLPGIGKAINLNKKAKVVFIDNLSKEFGPAGKMDHKMMLEWCERACSGRKVDIILTDKELNGLQQEYDCKKTDLASPNHDWRHDREKLKDAIIDLLK